MPRSVETAIHEDPGEGEEQYTFADLTVVHEDELADLDVTSAHSTDLCQDTVEGKVGGETSWDSQEFVTNTMREEQVNVTSAYSVWSESLV